MLTNVFSNHLDNNGTELSRLSRFVFALSFLVLPFVILYWMVPVFSNLTIGNDYSVYPIQAQMELAYSMEYDSFPLYAPGFAGGQSAAALTLGQIYHPISFIARMLPGYWDGDALKVNTFLRLLSLGVCHLFVFYLLRRLGLNVVSSLVLSFITVYNLRMLDLFRYGASLENHTAFIILSALIVLRYLSPSNWGINVGISVAAYLLVVGGHPQASYLGFIGAAIVTLITPFFVPVLMPEIQIDKGYRFKYWLGVLTFVLAGIFLAAPYILGLYFDFMSTNNLRVDKSYEWSLAYQDSWGGGLRNFYAPLQSDVSGSFGGSSLLMLMVALPALFVYRRRIPLVVLVSLILCVIFFLISLGDATPLHYFAWNFLPFADNFRVPGRFTVWIIFPLLFVLAWLFKAGLDRSIVVAPSINVSPLTVASILALFLFLLANISFDSLLPDSSRFTPQSINSFSNVVHKGVFYTGMAGLLLCAIYGCVNRQKKLQSGLVSTLLVVVMFSQVSLTLRYGTWVIEDKPQKTLAEMNQEKQQHFKLYSIPGYGMTTRAVDEQLERSIIEPKIARIYRSVVAVQDDGKMWDYMETERSSHDAVVLADESLAIAGLTTLVDSDTGVPDTVSLVEATYNKLVFEVVAVGRSFLSTNIPIRKNWKVTIGDKSVEVHKANGNETGVFIPSGAHRVVFTYESVETVTGVIVACVTLLALMLFVAWAVSGKCRAMIIVLSLILPGTLFYYWYQSLYHGLLMPAKYEWSSADFSDRNNLAYGKAVMPSSLFNEQMPYLSYAGLAVDGEKSMAYFASANTMRPSWELDLGKVYSLDLVNIYGMFGFSLPVSLFISSDREKYRSVVRIRRLSEVYDINMKGVEARYIVIRSDKKTSLAFKEVEVFGKPLKN